MVGTQRVVLWVVPLLVLIAIVRPCVADDVLVFTADPFNLPSPEARPDAASRAQVLEMTAMQGEYESLAFGVWTDGEGGEVTVNVTDLQGDRGSLDSVRADAWVVHWWEQAVWRSSPPRRVFVPELLLKDSDADLSGPGAPKLRLTGAPRAVLSSDRGTWFWLRLQIPTGTYPGKYQGHVVLDGPAAQMTIPLHVTVLPIRLEPVVRDTAIFYDGGLVHDGEADLRAVSEKVFRADLGTIRRAGFNALTIWGDSADELIAGIRMAREMGFTRKIILVVEGSTDVRIAKLRPVMAWAAEHQVDGLCVYGADEPNHWSISQSTRAAFARFQELGLTTVCCIDRDHAEALDDSLDIPVYDWTDWSNQRYMQEVWSESLAREGQPRWYYFQSWLDDNATLNRLQHGLLMHVVGLDGIMPYVYLAAQHQHLPDVFREGQEKRMAMVYPSVDGPIPTVLWHAAGEGIDDIRIVEALEHRLKLPRPAQGPAAAAAAAGRQLLDDIRKTIGPDFKQHPSVTSRAIGDIRESLIAAILAYDKAAIPPKSDVVQVTRFKEFVSIDNGVPGMVIRIAGSDSPDDPVLKGRLGLARCTANWYDGGFLAVNVNGQDAITRSLPTVSVVEQAASHARVRAVWDNDLGEFTVDLVALQGDDRLYVYYKGTPRDKTATTTLVLTAYPNSYGGGASAGSATRQRALLTADRDARGPAQVALKSSTSWAVLYDAYYDRALRHQTFKFNYGPCAVVFGQDQPPAGWSVDLQSYSVLVNIPLGKGAASTRFALYEFPASDNAEAFARVRNEVAQTRSLIAAYGSSRDRR